MNRIVSLAVAAALVLTLCAATAQAGKKNKNKTAPTNSVVGLITAVSEDGKTISVTSFGGKKKSPAAPAAVKLSDKTKIDYVGIKEKEEQKLAVGLAVIIGLEEQDSSTASTIVAAKMAAGKKKKK
jgi:hypothetical protein